jgi:hypothetical protein
MFTTASSRQKAEDLDLIVRYVKKNLFPKVKLIYDQKVDLIVGGHIYKDFKHKCNDRVRSWSLTEENRDIYIEALWTTSVTKHLQKSALSQKRSAVYTVMQNKCSGASGTFDTAVTFKVPANICVCCHHTCVKFV